jgi:dipeptidyl aminopeptidase/acylaminoacyl peptidase
MDRVAIGVQFIEPYSKSAASPTISQSPLTYAQNICTPTLLLHGEEDVDVPVDCGYAFFRALKTAGVPTSLNVYPSEPHGVSEKAHLVDMTQKTLDWLERWLPAAADHTQQNGAKL